MHIVTPYDTHTNGDPFRAKNVYHRELRNTVSRDSATNDNQGLPVVHYFLGALF